MKKVINGKMYNTETAEAVGIWSNDRAKNDFNYIVERLYRTKRGAYFIHGEGGAMTSYAESVGDMYGAGEAIRPVDEAGAREWAERHLTGEEYVEIFGEPEEA